MSHIMNPDIIAKDVQKGDYSAAEMALINAEIERIYADLTKNAKPSDKKTFYITTGGPGAGKTSLVSAAQKGDGMLSRAIHIDPDEVIKSFAPYSNAIAQAGDTDSARVAAYGKWRWASVYIANTMVNKLAADGFDIVLGTTGTSPAVGHIYDAAHRAGYGSVLLMCHANEETRLASVAKRFETERRFTPEADVKEKGNKLFPEVVALHLGKAHQAFIFWRGAVDSAPVLAAEYHGGQTVVRDMKAFSGFMAEMRVHKPEVDWAGVMGMQKKPDIKPPHI